MLQAITDPRGRGHIGTQHTTWSQVHLGPANISHIPANPQMQGQEQRMLIVVHRGDLVVICYTANASSFSLVRLGKTFGISPGCRRKSFNNFMQTVLSPRYQFTAGV